MQARAATLLNTGDGARVARSTGDAPATVAGAGKTLNATYGVPYLAHATLEPMNATALVRDDSCAIWAPTQGQIAAVATAAAMTPLDIRTVSPSIVFQRNPKALDAPGFFDRIAVEGLADMPYGLDHLRVEWVRSSRPVGFRCCLRCAWRSGRSSWPHARRRPGPHPATRTPGGGVGTN